MDKIADALLLPKISFLWLMTSALCVVLYSHIGWWAIAWYAGLAVPVSLAEALWEKHNERR